MTVNEAKKKIHWHVRDADSVRPEPYGSPAAARCAMQIRGEPMPGFWVKKIGLRGDCPCRAESSMPRKSPAHSALESGDCEVLAPKKLATSLAAPVSSDRKVQTPRKEGEPNTKSTASSTLGMKHAGAATLSTSVNPTSYDPSVAPAKSPTGEVAPCARRDVVSSSCEATSPINSTGAGCAEAQPSQPRALLASAPTQSTYGQAELSYLNARSDGGMEG